MNQDQIKEAEATLPSLPRQLIEELGDTQMSIFLQFLATGVLQALYARQLEVLNEKLRIPNLHLNDEQLARHVRKIQYEHQATRATIETLNGYIN